MTAADVSRDTRQIPRLSGDDLKLLRTLAEGASLTEAARRLHVGHRTVSRRITDICVRLEVGTTVEAVVWAVRRGLL